MGCGPQVGPFLSWPTMGSIRGEGTPPTNPSRDLKKERSELPLKWLLKEDRRRRPTAAADAAAAIAAHRRAATPIAETAASSCSSHALVVPPHDRSCPSAHHLFQVPGQGTSGQPMPVFKPAYRVRRRCPRLYSR